MTLNYGEAVPCDVSENKPETVKSILESMEDVLKELYNQLRMIDDAIYSPKNGENSKALDDPKQECLLGTLTRQRNIADAVLHLAVHIREGMW